ncbi:partial ribosome biogenesis GTPase / thiamine phosphate phosphatase [Gammaproteobacteria bacterium]|nr:partial ribosome biogenesis GTPase / thiamine phosphate phosphatase [Gammaproteobacteria bacterium]
MPLTRFGWDREFEAQFENHAREGFAPARVLTATRETYRLATAGGELPAELSGRLRFAAESSADLPAVGDWVAARVYPGDGLAVVDSVLPRRTALVRRSSGRRDEAQVLAANVDLLLVAAPLGGELRERRIERFLALAREADVAPAVLLTKSDLADDPAVDLAAARAVAGDAPVVVVSARTGAGLDALEPFLPPRRTAALLGPSGAGKSTLVNALLGESRQSTREVRECDLRGRHATTSRELFTLPGGALLVDTPGLRELALWDGAEAIAETYDEVATLAPLCRFRDCRHEGEPGCAVRAAADEGVIDPDRLAAFEKLRREDEVLAERRALGPARAERERWRRMMGGSKGPVKVR